MEPAGVFADSVGFVAEVFEEVVLEEVVPEVVGFWITPLGVGDGVVGTGFSFSRTGCLLGSSFPPSVEGAVVGVKFSSPLMGLEPVVVPLLSLGGVVVGIRFSSPGRGLLGPFVVLLEEAGASVASVGFSVTPGNKGFVVFPEAASVGAVVSNCVWGLVNVPGLVTLPVLITQLANTGVAITDASKIVIAIQVTTLFISFIMITSNFL